MKFKVGDRVAAYNCTRRYVGVVRDIDLRHEPNTLVIETAEDTHSYHPKQCRLLVKKPRRRIWIDAEYFPKEPNNIRERVGYGTCKFRDSDVEFIEVRKPK